MDNPVLINPLTTQVNTENADNKQSPVTASVFVSIYSDDLNIPDDPVDGKWFDLSEYSNYNDFITAATRYAKAHFSVDIPSLRFSQYFSSPASLSTLFSETDVSRSVWDYLGVTIEEAEILLSYEAIVGKNDQEPRDRLQEAQRFYMGQFESWEHFAVNLVKDELKKISPFVIGFINFEDMGDRLQSDYTQIDGRFFKIADTTNISIDASLGRTERQA